MKTKKTTGATVHYRDDKIVHIVYDNKLFSKAEVESIFNFIREHNPWEVAPILATGSTFTNFEGDAMKFLTSEVVLQYCSAVAMVSKTLGEKIAANFYLNLSRPLRPTKVFTTEQDAITWLKQYETVLKK